MLSRGVDIRGMPHRLTIVSFLKKNRLALILLAAVWAAFFSPLLVGGKVYFLEDLKEIYLPLEHWYAQAQHAGELPVWSPYFGFGQPTIAWGQLGFFTPLHFLMRAMSIPPLELLQVSVMAYFALSLLGMFLWLRRHVSSMASALGSIVFVFSGFNIGHLGHVNFYTATMVLPYLLLAIDALIARPTLYRALGVSVLGATMALSGQPQVVSYSFILATLVALCLLLPYVLTPRRHTRHLLRLLGLTSVSAVLAFCIASFAILPLFEFLPLTDRAGTLPEAELFEFSYPPYHAITLLFPYFFGNYERYTGPKGFHELAAFTGIIPLLLAGVGILWGRRTRSLRAAAFILMVIAAVLALGRYSPLYTWLVQQKIVTALAVPGRFVFFFDVGIAVAAALGLEILLSYQQQPRWRRVGILLSLVILPVLLLSGFFWQLQSDSDLYHRFVVATQPTNLSWVLLWVGVASVISIPLLQARLSHRLHQLLPHLLVITTATTLVALGWNYNPHSDRTSIGTISPLIAPLRQYEIQSGLPARVYAAETILAQIPTDPSTHKTERLGPNFTIHQVVKIRKDDATCLEVPVRVNHSFFGTTHISLRETLESRPLETIVLPAERILDESPLQLCFPQLAGLVGKSVVISFASDHLSPLELLYTAYTQEEEPVYFVRKPQPTQAELFASRKAARLVFTTYYPTQGDQEGIFLARHLQALGNASSARWISALSIGNYRAFVEQFFANDRGAVDGDGVHALVRFRNILNMSGVTHLIQTLPHGAEDGLLAAGYSLLENHDVGSREVRLYANPQVLPKAFVVAQAVFKPAADETRHAMQSEPYEPRQVVYVTGTKPPPIDVTLDQQDVVAQANILKYQSTRVDVAVETSREAFLVLTDATTPQWQTYIDDQPAPYYVANTIFKAALVPAGSHVVSFRYDSPAVKLSQKLTVGGLLLLLFLAAVPLLRTRHSKSARAPVMPGG